MKDFDEFLKNHDEKKISHFQSHIKNSSIEDTEFMDLEETWIQKTKKIIVMYGGAFGLYLLTGPFNTCSVLMQITDKPLVNQLEKKVQFLGKDNRYAKNGIYGDNKIYKSSPVMNYHDCLSKLGKQGLRGMYKGNLTAMIFAVSNTKLRGLFYSETSKNINISSEWLKNLVTVLTCSLADFLTLPIMLCQSRLVLQNSLSNFRTYKSPIEILRKTGPKMWFAGSSLLVIKNIFFTYSWLSFIKQSPVYSFILSTVLSHVVIYPFVTVIRQLQCNDRSVGMMHSREEKVRDCVKRIWDRLGVRGFYRGFLGYGLVHTFLGIIIVEMNIRKGFFDEM